MKRRVFLAASAAGLGVASESASAGARSGDRGNRQVLDLRVYRFKTPEKLMGAEQFAAAAAIPALNRLGIQPVGVFRMNKADNPEAKFEGETSLELFVLLPHPSLESVVTLDARLAADRAYTEALAGVKEEPRDPAYTRYESSLMLGFDQAPKVEVPTRAPSRVLQLRIYEAYNAERNRMKVRMFNEGGEIRIFREVGMHPVFFGHAFAGTRLPNLTYMLGFENEAALKTAWDKFLKHPDWQKLRVDPLYKDTVSTITNMVLRPVAGSQI